MKFFVLSLQRDECYSTVKNHSHPTGKSQAIYSLIEPRTVRPEFECSYVKSVLSELQLPDSIATELLVSELHQVHLSIPGLQCIFLLPQVDSTVGPAQSLSLQIVGIHGRILHLSPNR